MLVKDAMLQEFGFKCVDCGSAWNVQYRVEHVEDGRGHEADYYFFNGLPSLDPQRDTPICPNCRRVHVRVSAAGRRPMSEADTASGPDGRDLTGSAGRHAAAAAEPLATWLRVVTYQAEGPDQGRSVDYIRASTRGVTRMLESLDGCRACHWGEDPVAGTVSALSYWDSLEAINSAQPLLDRLHAERARYGVVVHSACNIRLIDAQLPASLGLVPA